MKVLERVSRHKNEKKNMATGYPLKFPVFFP